MDKLRKLQKLQPRSLTKALGYHIGILTTLFVITLILFLTDFSNRVVKITAGSVIILAFLWSLYSLRIYVCMPIKRVEEAMELLSTGDNNLYKALDLETDSASLSMHLHELIQLLKDSFDREYTADILKKEAELNALQSQINPHFLYNVLDTIRGHALTEGVKEIAEMTEALSNLFRYSISHWESEVTMERELLNVRSYFKIQQYRFNNKFDLRIIIENDEDQVLSCKLPKLTLQPIIENAIYHGLEIKMGKGLVTIRAKLTNELLSIEISDDGIGVEPYNLERINKNFLEWNHIEKYQNQSTGSGIALTNVNSRIKMMYGEEYGLHMYSTKGFGAMIEILLPAVRN